MKDVLSAALGADWLRSWKASRASHRSADGVSSMQQLLPLTCSSIRGHHIRAKCRVPRAEPNKFVLGRHRLLRAVADRRDASRRVKHFSDRFARVNPHVQSPPRDLSAPKRRLLHLLVCNVKYVPHLCVCESSRVLCDCDEESLVVACVRPCLAHLPSCDVGGQSHSMFECKRDEFTGKFRSRTLSAASFHFWLCAVNRCLHFISN